MEINLFPTPIYKRSIRPTESEKNTCDEFFANIIDKLDKNVWPGESGKSTGYYDVDLHTRPEFKWLFDKMVEPLNTYWWEVLKYHHALVPTITSSWANLHMKGESTDVHSHVDGYDGLNHISGVFYYKKQKEEENIKFANPLDSLLRCQPYRDMKGIEEISTPLETESYDLLIFPSWLRHRVDPNVLDEPRIAISFNCRGNYAGTENFIR